MLNAVSFGLRSFCLLSFPHCNDICLVALFYYLSYLFLTLFRFYNFYCDINNAWVKFQISFIYHIILWLYLYKFYVGAHHLMAHVDFFSSLTRYCCCPVKLPFLHLWFTGSFSFQKWNLHSQCHFVLCNTCKLDSNFSGWKFFSLRNFSFLCSRHSVFTIFFLVIGAYIDCLRPLE